MDTDTSELHPALAFWCLLRVQQDMLLAPVRTGCSAEQMMHAYVSLYGHMTHEKHTEKAWLIGCYIGGLMAWQAKEHLQ